MKKFAVIIISHGYFAREALASAELITGKQENVGSMAITMETEINVAKEELKKLMNTLDLSQGLLLLTDILGGSPSKLAIEQLLAKENELNIVAITGTNLPILLDLFINRGDNLQEISKSLESTYKEGYKLLNELIMEDDKDDEYSVS